MSVNRRSLLGVLAVGSVTGCLRLTEQGRDNTGDSTGAGQASPTMSSTQTTPENLTVTGFEEQWNHEDAGLNVNFSPNLLQADGDNLLAFGTQTALIDPAVPAPINTVDVTNGRDVETYSVSTALVSEDACYVGTNGEKPLIVQLDRKASTVEGSVALSEEYDEVSDLALYDDLLFAAVNSSDPTRGQLVVGNVTTGEQISHIVWPDKNVPSLEIYDETVLIGGVGAGSNAYSIPDQEVLEAEERFGFEFDHRFSVHDDTIYDVSGRIRARDIETGDLVFENELLTTPQHPPVLSNGRVYVMSESGVRAFSPTTGEEQWSARTAAMVLSAPVFNDQLAFFSDNSNIIYSVDIENGEILHETDPFEYYLGDIELVNGTLFAAIDGFRALAIQTE